MDTQYLKDYSPALGRDMEFQVYGHSGQPVLYSLKYCVSMVAYSFTVV